jgi:hypothetical protein
MKCGVLTHGNAGPIFFGAIGAILIALVQLLGPIAT